MSILDTENTNETTQFKTSSDVFAPTSHLCSWHHSDLTYRLNRKPACYHPQRVILLQTCLQAAYLISSHSVARPKLNEATVGVPHAINAVRGFKASNLEKEVLHSKLVSRKKKCEGVQKILAYLSNQKQVSDREI